eukprot:m.718452 g.718452  ORF g.718452 m.718452 type:complete len:263 (+) comp22995_c0_seq2:5245-6033(+)
MQDRNNDCHPLQSYDLYNLTNCTDESLQINVGEGPHVTGSRLNHAEAHPWNGFAWLNYEGGFVWRSSDGGLSWTQQSERLFRGGGVKYLDVGVAHQGPLLPQSDGTMYVLYFTEFSTSPVGLERTQVNSRRSVLQLAPVTYNHTTSTLECDRDASFLHRLLPPVGAVGPRTAPVVTSIAVGEATIIALAELNRWHGGWFRHTPSPGTRNHGIQYAYRLGAAFYREVAAASPAACVALRVTKDHHMCSPHTFWMWWAVYAVDA